MGSLVFFKVMIEAEEEVLEVDISICVLMSFMSFFIKIKLFNFQKRIMYCY